jgi:hypothetical protein
MPCSSPPNIDLNPAPNWEKAFRDRTVSPKTSPHTRWISQPGRSLVVTTSTGQPFCRDEKWAGSRCRVPPRAAVDIFDKANVEEVA